LPRSSWRRNGNVLDALAVILIPDGGFSVDDGVVATEWEALASAEVLVPELGGGARNLDTWAAAAAVFIENFGG